MTDNNHPITPPPELVRQWMERTEYDEHTWFYESYIAEQAARWGADMELQASCEWFQEFYKTESWGNHPANPDSSLQPIPVSERLPTDEDCDKEGSCWWWHPSHPESSYSEGWMQRSRQWGILRYDFDDALVYTHWLPAHALPLPTHE